MNTPEQPATSEVMDLTKISSTLPQPAKSEIQRENMLLTVSEMLRGEAEIVLVEGPDGIGKTTLLSQFVRSMPQVAFSLFIRSSSRYAYDSVMLAKDLCDQIGWAILKESYRTKQDADPQQTLRANIYELQKQANYMGTTYYFVVDGLDDIPREDSHEREFILDLLPFGLKGFRFVLSGGCLGNRAARLQRVSSFRLPPFSLEDTARFLSDFMTERSALETIYKVTKGMPGALASVRRLLQSGVSVEQLLNDLPNQLPDMFELEWRAVPNDNPLLRQALAILAFDHRQHSVRTLARLCNVNMDVLEEHLEACNFVHRAPDKGEVGYESEVFKKFAASRLASLKRQALDTVINDLLSNPESPEALMHLPSVLHEAHRYDELLKYLSPEHIGELIDCADSWVPLHQKADLGVNTALDLQRDGDLLMFGLQRATIASMEAAEPWRSEIQAYVALGDFSTAFALAQRTATKEDRLQLLAVIARAKKQRSLSIEPELVDQIRQLYSVIDKSSLGARAVEIASDLMYSNPELAADLVQEHIARPDPEEGVRDALAQFSVKTFVDSNKQPELQTVCETLKERMKGSKMQHFIDAVSLFLGGHSAENVMAEVDKWQDVAGRILILRVWALVNIRRPDAAQVVEYALNTVLRTTTYGINARVFSDLAQPLPYSSDLDRVRQLVSRFDALKGVIESTGPTQEYFRLQGTLAEAESRYDRRAAIGRIVGAYCQVDSINDCSTKMASLSVLAGALRKIDEKGEFEPDFGIHKAVTQGLQSAVQKLLSDTADQYIVTRTAIRVLATSNPKMALDIASSLNTEPRRDDALVDVLKAHSEQLPSSIDFDFIHRTYGEIRSATNHQHAALAVLNRLSQRKQDLLAYLPSVIPMQEWVEEIPDMAVRCRAICALMEILLEHKSAVNPDILKALHEKLERAWATTDVGWNKVDTGFRIVSALAESCPEYSRKFLEATECARRDVVLDCLGAAHTYVYCIELTIRCLSGLFEGEHYTEDDLCHLESLLNRIPSASVRAKLWAELALKLFLAHELTQFQKLVAQKLRPIVESEGFTDPESKWSTVAATAPALYFAHKASAEQIIGALPAEYQDIAYSAICGVLITKTSHFEPQDTQLNKLRGISYEDFLDAFAALDHIGADNYVSYWLEKLVRRMEKGFRRSFNKAQIADTLSRLRGLVARKFPNPLFIKHEGYRILGESQIAKLEHGGGKGLWNGLIDRARAVPNIADRAFVLMQIASALPSSMFTKVAPLLNEAKDLVAQIPTPEDRASRYESLAQVAADSNPRLAKEALRLAWDETFPTETEDTERARRRIVDIAYRLDPEFAADIASRLDKDPGRNAARAAGKDQLDTLRMRDKLSKGDVDQPLSDQSAKRHARAARMMLASLNSNRSLPVQLDSTRRYVRLASKMKIEDAYAVLSWVVENAVKKHSNTPQALGILRPMYEAARLSSELAYRIAARIRSVTDSGLAAARSGTSPSIGIIREGEREKAFGIIREWVAQNATGFIKITDPYFGPEDLEMVKLIRSVDADIPIHILASRKYQQDRAVQAPWEDAYRTHWRLAVADSSPGPVSITVVGKESTGAHPIHDRWWLSEKSGLRTGTSSNSIGVGKVSEVSVIPEASVPGMLVEVDRYFGRLVLESGSDRILYTSFNL